MFQKGSHISYMFKVCWYCKSISKGFQGSKIQKSWNFKVLVPPIIKTKFHQTKMKQNNSPELSNLLLKHIFHKNDLANANKTLKSF